MDGRKRSNSYLAGWVVDPALVPKGISFHSSTCIDKRAGRQAHDAPKLTIIQQLSCCLHKGIFLDQDSKFGSGLLNPTTSRVDLLWGGLLADSAFSTAQVYLP